MHKGKHHSEQVLSTKCQVTACYYQNISLCHSTARYFIPRKQKQGIFLLKRLYFPVSYGVVHSSKPLWYVRIVWWQTWKNSNLSFKSFKVGLNVKFWNCIGHDVMWKNLWRYNTCGPPDEAEQQCGTDKGPAPHMDILYSGHAQEDED